MKHITLSLLSTALLVACQPSAEPGNTGDTPTPQPSVSDEPERVWLATAPLSGVGDYNANGATRSDFFDDRTYKHELELNIEQAKEGYFYEGWLVNPENGNFISTGEVENIAGDVRHKMEFEVRRDLRPYMKVVVTLEPDDGDPAPAEHVAEGTLIVREGV